MNQTTDPIAGGPAKPGYNPLYRQVKDRLIERIAAGEWPPGGLLPSEQQLALELGVSQGTVRKALDEMSAENLVVRRQGRGTFVSEHTQQRTLFQFFMITADDGRRQFPETVSSRLTLQKAAASERELLGLGDSDKVWRIKRHRAIDGKVMVVERIVLSERGFPALDTHAPLPNNVYAFYEQTYATAITRAEERLKAVAASRADALVLGCEVGHPVMRIDRVAYGITGATIELRESICLTDSVHYLSDLQ